MRHENKSFNVSAELFSAIAAAAQAEGKTAEEWMAEAAREKLRKRALDERWEALTHRLQSYAIEHGCEPDDVDAAIHEYRRGQ